MGLKTQIIGLQGQQRPARSLVMRNRKVEEQRRVYSKIVERYAMSIDRPEVRLRFLNNTLAKQMQWQQKLQHSLRHFKFLEETRFYKWMIEARFYSAILDELKILARTLPRYKRLQKVRVPVAARAYVVLHQARHALYAAGAAMICISIFGLYLFSAWSIRNINDYLTQRYQASTSNVSTALVARASTPPAAPTGYPTAYQPEKIFFVGKEGDEEHYSNGARIKTRYETTTNPRSYYLIPRGTDTAGEQLHREVVGIVYHTSESDIIPFVPENSDNIRKRTHGLIEYIKRITAYNYLIDRFGGIYRIVRDDNVAHHSGYSVWADSNYAYVGLNESFIGVCFESSVNSGAEERLSDAQIISGRQLTEVLRKKYNIDDANCTAHGLVSVNPEKMLIAYHHDWVRNFPWEAMGLTDKYQVPPPNIADYGFTYDDEVLAKLGGALWPGAALADEEFKKRAERQRLDLDVLRRRLLDVYMAQHRKSHTG